VSRSTRTGAPLVYAAAEKFRDTCLRAGDSLFLPGRAVWSAANLQEFHRRFIGAAILGKEQNFLQKLKVQLNGASDAVIALAAEITYVYYLVDAQTTGEKKRKNITGVLAFASVPISIPQPLDAALDDGLVHPGVAFNTLRFNQLSFLTEFAIKWTTSLSPAEREAALADPWMFRDVVFSVEPKGGQTMREALLNLIFPDSFEAITSRTHKLRITDAFKNLVSDLEANRDRQLLAIREKLSDGQPNFDFYRKDVRERWDQEAPKPAKEADGWFVAQAADSPYGDIEGIAYEYPAGLPNARKIKKHDVLVVYSLDIKRVIGLGRVGSFVPRGKGRVAAVYDHYLQLMSPASLDEIGGDPRPNVQLSISQLPPGVVDVLLEREGLTSITEAPVVEAELPLVPPTDEPLHVLLKWNADREPLTIERHREIADREGSVWWGRFARAGAPGVSPGKVSDLRHQLEHGVPTYAFLYRRGKTWKTRIQEVATNPNEVDEKRIPEYYAKAECNAFFRVSDFEPTEESWLEAHVRLASNPGDADAFVGALGNQTTPLFVHTIEDVVVPGPKLPELTLDWLERETLWTRTALEDIIESLTGARSREGVRPETLRRAKRAIILAGPPGTSKTWIADKIASYLTQNEALASQTVQFHPSYGYEEFIEGLRPIPAAGGLVFDRVDGTVLEMAKQISREDQLHVLLIDEMNRANLPKVFGELMYALEYRDKPVNLLYTGDFHLPHNLLFIGTMNTADRSIRSIDIALRRRFEVFECPADPAVLDGYYASHVNEVPDLLAGLDRLNKALTERLDRHHTIGHAFFMGDPFKPRRLMQIWTRQLLPLIEDYFFDQPDVMAEFKAANFWPSLSADPIPPGI
jgi:hypothetical protein